MVVERVLCHCPTLGEGRGGRMSSHFPSLPLPSPSLVKSFVCDRRLNAHPRLGAVRSSTFLESLLDKLWWECIMSTLLTPGFDCLPKPADHSPSALLVRRPKGKSRWTCQVSTVSRQKQGTPTTYPTGKDTECVAKTTRRPPTKVHTD